MTRSSPILAEVSRHRDLIALGWDEGLRREEKTRLLGGYKSSDFYFGELLRPDGKELSGLLLLHPHFFFFFFTLVPLSAFKFRFTKRVVAGPRESAQHPASHSPSIRSREGRGDSAAYWAVGKVCICSNDFSHRSSYFGTL